LDLSLKGIYSYEFCGGWVYALPGRAGVDSVVTTYFGGAVGGVFGSDAAKN
jgi:hypothetical protein